MDGSQASTTDLQQSSRLTEDELRRNWELVQARLIDGSDTNPNICDSEFHLREHQ